MKNRLYILITMSAFLLALSSCQDDSKERLPEITKVVAMRLSIDPDFQFLDGLDVANAVLKMDLFHEGDPLDKVELYVDYYSFSQDSTYNQALVHTWAAADFNNAGGDANIISDFTLPSTTISSAVQIDMVDMAGGDRLDFSIVTILADGRKFPDTIEAINGEEPQLNVTPNILNSSASTSLTTSFTSFIACPVPDGYLTGNYKFKQVSGPSDPFFGTGDLIAATDVNIGATSPIGREFGNLSYATFGGGAINLLLVCNNILVPYGPAPAGCGGGLGWIGDTSNIFVYDDGDDSSITLNLFHNPLGDCGLPTNEPWVFSLTKIE